MIGQIVNQRELGKKTAKESLPEFRTNSKDLPLKQPLTEFSWIDPQRKHITFRH